LVLAILDGDQALSTVGARVEERGMRPLLQADVGRASLNDSRLGQLLASLLAANLHRVLGALALQALAVDSLETAWRHQDTTTLAL
jgi:hypothetical protein